MTVATGRPELRRGRVHEVVSAVPGDAAARLFAAFATTEREDACLWITGGRIPTLCPHGFHGLIDANALTLVEVRDPMEGLWVAEEALRSGAVRVVVVENQRAVDLLQSRRLQLAAEAGSALGLLLGPDSGNTAVETRWRCSSVSEGGERQIRFDWQQVKNKKGSKSRWKAVRDEATGRMRVAPASGGGAGRQIPSRSGQAVCDHRGGEQRLAALLAEHGGEASGADWRHGAG